MATKPLPRSIIHPPTIASIPSAMSSSPDLNSLVAFAAKHLSKSSGLPALTRNDSYITPDKPKILDALAVLCVTKENPEPVAVAVTIDRMSHQVHLLISQTGVENLDASRLHHIRKVWKFLQDLSHKYDDSQPVSTSPVANPSDRKQFKALLCYVYGYQGDLVMETIREWWPQLDVVHRNLGRSLKRSGKKPVGLQCHFMEAVLALRQVVKIIGNDFSMPRSGNWQLVIVLMGLASFHTRLLLCQWEKCEEWGTAFANTAWAGPSPARCALSNITSLHRHLATLRIFAASPRPADIFDYALHISFLPCQSIPIELPSNWKPMLYQLSHDDSLEDWYARESAELGATYATPQHCAPHPECNIISYLHTQHEYTTPPLGYIGLSAPACAACAIWIDAYHGRERRDSSFCGSWYYHPRRSRTERRPKRKCFQYRGSSDGWCWPWTLPGPLGAKEMVLVKEVTIRCRDYLRRTGKFDYPPRALSLMNEDDLMRAKRAVIAEWELENTEICVFGCTNGTGCGCFTALWE